MTNQNGNVIERYSYTAYGELGIDGQVEWRERQATFDNRYTYIGCKWGEDVELYQYRARVYDPLTGQICSRDSIGYVRSEWNLYEFGASNPCNSMDPNGTSVFTNPLGPLTPTPNPPSIPPWIGKVCRRGGVAGYFLSCAAYNIDLNFFAARTCLGNPNFNACVRARLRQIGWNPILMDVLCTPPPTIILRRILR